jgi:ATP-binding cassette subfamily F protein 3
MDKKVKELSGGERAKLALCVFESERGNVLLLDEPTNHLDLPARESLEKALKEFDGTVIFVSHDRYFITAIADGIVEIEEKRLNYYDGNYDYYKAQKERAAQEKLDEIKAQEQKAYEEAKAASYRSKKERAEEAKKKARIKQLEADISACEEQEERLNNLLSDPSITADYTKLNDVLKELNQVKERSEKLYEEYEKLL